MYFRKKSLEEIPVEKTAVWSCTKEGCTGWMRDNFAFDSSPVCRQCLSPMTINDQMLPLLVNTNIDMKSIKKGVQIRSR